MASGTDGAASTVNSQPSVDSAERTDDASAPLAGTPERPATVPSGSVESDAGAATEPRAPLPGRQSADAGADAGNVEDAGIGCSGCVESHEAEPGLVETIEDPQCGPLVVLEVTRFAATPELRASSEGFYIYVRPHLDDAPQVAYRAVLVAGEVLPTWATVGATSLAHILITLNDDAPAPASFSSAVYLVGPVDDCPLALVPFEVYVTD